MLLAEAAILLLASLAALVALVTAFWASAAVLAAASRPLPASTMCMSDSLWLSRRPHAAFLAA